MNSACQFNVLFSWACAIENFETTLSLNKVVGEPQAFVCLYNHNCMMEGDE
jgi:hypothetical protein